MNKMWYIHMIEIFRRNEPYIRDFKNKVEKVNWRKWFHLCKLSIKQHIVYVYLYICTCSIHIYWLEWYPPNSYDENHLAMVGRGKEMGVKGYDYITYKNYL